MGPGATLTQCAAVDSSGNVACVFSYFFALWYLIFLAGLPQGDFFLIAHSEFLGPLCFLIARAEMYRNRLMAYAGDNQNVTQRVKFRRTENRIAQYFCRVANRVDVDFVFAVFLSI